jgi:hypothetical protein
MLRKLPKNSFIILALQHIIFLLFYYLFKLQKWVFTRWQCTRITHITQITHHTQTTTAHKTTQTIKGTLHTMKVTKSRGIRLED